MIEIKVTEDHIRHAKWAAWHRPSDPRRDAIETAIKDAGFDAVRIEYHINLIPPNHDWAIHLRGTRYRMTTSMRCYYDDFRIEHGHRTEEAIIRFCPESATVDVAILPPDTRTEWEKAGMSYTTWMDQDPYTLAYREARRRSKTSDLSDPDDFRYYQSLIRAIGQKGHNEK